MQVPNPSLAGERRTLFSTLFVDESGHEVLLQAVPAMAPTEAYEALLKAARRQAERGAVLLSSQMRMPKAYEDAQASMKAFAAFLGLSVVPELETLTDVPWAYGGFTYEDLTASERAALLTAMKATQGVMVLYRKTQEMGDQERVTSLRENTLRNVFRNLEGATKPSSFLSTLLERVAARRIRRSHVMALRKDLRSARRTRTPLTLFWDTAYTDALEDLLWQEGYTRVEVTEQVFALTYQEGRLTMVLEDTPQDEVPSKA